MNVDDTGPANEAVIARLAGAVVDECLASGRGVADVMSKRVALRRRPAGVRGAVARLSVQVLGALRWLRFVLDDDDAAGLLLVRAAQLVGCDGRRAADQALRERLAAIDAPARRLGIELSVPDWLVPKLQQAFGAATADVLAALAAAAPRTVRANLLRVASRDELIVRLAAEGVPAAPARWCDTAVHVSGSADLFRTGAFAAGWFEQQDEASQLAVQLVAPPPRGRVLDLCCGSGGKTLGLAAALRNRGAVMACDVHAARVRELRARLPRAGVDDVEPVWRDGSAEVEARIAAFAGSAARIFVDAPCSGTGSWRRRPQARWQIDERDLARLVQQQRALLREAAGWLRPGARLIYATCSLLPEENQQQIEWLMRTTSGLELVSLRELIGREAAGRIGDANGDCLALRPDRHGCDGFFLGVLRRRRAD